MAQSNSLFIALPFILAFITLIASFVTTTYRNLPLLQDRSMASKTNPAEETEQESLVGTSSEEEEELPEKDKLQAIHTIPPRFINRVRLSIVICLLISLIFSAVVCWTMFGSNSSFYKQNAALKSTYRLSNGAEIGSRCRPVQSQSGGNLLELPSLTLEQRSYQTLDSFGNHFPNAKETSWRLYICFVLGLFAPVVLAVVVQFVTCVTRSCARRVAENGQFGASSVLIEGLGFSFVCTMISFLCVYILVLSCYRLFGAYGIGICSLGMLAMYGPVGALSTLDVVCRNGDGMINMCSVMTNNDRDKGKEKIGGGTLSKLGRVFSAKQRMILNANAGMCLITLVFVIILQSNLYANATQLVGTVTTPPSKHISDVKDIDPMDIYVLTGTIVGMFMPLLYCSIMMFGLARAGRRVYEEIRRQTKEKPGLLRGTYSTIADYDACTNIVRRDSNAQLILPWLVTLVPPLIIGFGFGQKALVGMNVGMICSGFFVSGMMSCGYGVWESAAILVEHDGFGRKNGKGSRWHQAMRSGRAFGEMFGKSIGPNISVMIGTSATLSIIVIGSMQSTSLKRGWIGLILLLVWMFVMGVVMAKLNGGKGKVRFERGSGAIASGAVCEDKMDKVGINTDAVSPFFEEGPSIGVEYVGTESQLAHDGGMRDGEGGNEEMRMMEG